ncbi:hypothetical protein ACFE04_011471 [Oxalis oulophora]
MSLPVTGLTSPSHSTLDSFLLLACSIDLKSGFPVSGTKSESRSKSGESEAHQAANRCVAAGDIGGSAKDLKCGGRQVPVSQQYWRKRIGPSLADRSRVELALLPRLSLTRLSRTQSLFLFGGSFFTLFLLPAGSAATKVGDLYSKGNSGFAAFSYRGLFLLSDLTQLDLLDSAHDSHGLAARSQLNDQSIGCFHLWPSSTALTP